jgi:hypothetical protein
MADAAEFDIDDHIIGAWLPSFQRKGRQRGFGSMGGIGFGFNHKKML